MSNATNEETKKPQSMLAKSILKLFVENVSWNESIKNESTTTTAIKTSTSKSDKIKIT